MNYAKTMILGFVLLALLAVPAFAGSYGYCGFRYTPTACGASQRFVINQGELSWANIYGFRLDDLETHSAGNSTLTGAIISVLQKDCSVVKKDWIPAGATKTIVINGYAGLFTYDVTVNAVAPGYSFGAKWADLTVTRVC